MLGYCYKKRANFTEKFSVCRMFRFGCVFARGGWVFLTCWGSGGWMVLLGDSLLGGVVGEIAPTPSPTGVGPDRGFWHDKHPTKCPSVSQQPETQPWVLRSPTTPPESPSTRLSLGQLAPLEALSDYLLDRRASIAVQLSSIRDTGRLNGINYH